MTKINPALDPAAYVGMAARIATGMGKPSELRDQADQILAALANGDKIILQRYRDALTLSSNMASQLMLQKAMQAETPEQAQQWMKAALQATKLQADMDKLVPRLPDATKETQVEEILRREELGAPPIKAFLLDVDLDALRVQRGMRTHADWAGLTPKLINH